MALWARVTLQMRGMALLAIVVLGVGGVSEATPPEHPLGALARIAEEQGVEKVRDRYQSHVQTFVAELEKGRRPDSPEELQRHLMTVNWLFDYLSSWAYVEARAARRSGQVDSQFMDSVFEPILKASTAAVEEYARLQSKATREELLRWGLMLESPGSVGGSRNDAAERVALLAWVAGGGDWVIRAFDAFGGRMKSYRSADEFLAHPPDVDHLLNLVEAGTQQESVSRFAETTTLEEALYDRMRDGDLAGARVGFKGLLDKKLEWLKTMRVQPPRNIEELARQAAELRSVVQTIHLWQIAEVEVRLRGGQTPEPVLGDIMAALGPVKDHAGVIDRSARVLLDPESRKRGPGRNVPLVIEGAGELFLVSVAFFRDTSQAKHRHDFLAEAQRYVPAPKTLEEFDARHNGDLRKEFNFFDDAPADEPGGRK